ncbi:hypothetical protein PG987_001924 [Apiospora arundinis]
MSLDSTNASDHDRSDQVNSEVISDLYTKTMENFNQVLLELDSDPHLSNLPVLEIAFEECTRLKVWGLQNRVTLPENTPGSMAAHLKDQPELEQLVFEVLHDASSTLSRIIQDVEEGGAVSISETVKDDSDSDSSSSSDDISSPSLIRYLKRVFENVVELYRLQDLFRSPRMKGKYIHSSLTQSDLPYYQQDYQHVRQKLDDWNRTSAPVSADQEGTQNAKPFLCPTEPDETPGLSPDSLFQRQQIEERSEELMDKLCRRFAIANSKRRKQLRYWQSHPYQVTQQDSTDGAEQKKLANRVNVMCITKGSTSEHGAPNSEKLPTTIHSFSTAPRSAIMITERSQHRDHVARTTYQPSVVGTHMRTTIRVPDIPKITGDPEATKCPYCQVPLNSEILSSRESWKRHVFRDLRPYYIKLLDHVAGHLEEISLFALPRVTLFGDDDDDKSKSNEAHGELSNRSCDHETTSWIPFGPSQIRPKSLLRNIFFQAKKADRVANSLEQWAHLKSHSSKINTPTAY